MGIKASLAFTALSLALASAPASATTFTFNKTDFGSNTNVGRPTAISTTFNNNTNLFTWSSTFSKVKDGSLADGAWLVLNGGGNPKNQASEYAIYYLDGKKEKVTAYAYSGENNSNSYKVSSLLASTPLTVKKEGTQSTFSFALNVAGLNSLNISDDWKGTSFGKDIGIWFHGVDGLTTKYDKSGKLSNFTFTKQGAYDIDVEHTQPVPEPATTAALGVLAATAAVSKLRKQST